MGIAAAEKCGRIVVQKEEGSMICEVKVGGVKFDVLQVVEIRVALRKHVESLQEQHDRMVEYGIDQKVIDSHVEWMRHAEKAMEAFESVTPV